MSQINRSETRVHQDTTTISSRAVHCSYIRHGRQRRTPVSGVSRSPCNSCKCTTDMVLISCFNNLKCSGYVYANTAGYIYCAPYSNISCRGIAPVSVGTPFSWDSSIGQQSDTGSLRCPSAYICAYIALGKAGPYPHMTAQKSRQQEPQFHI